MSHGGRPDSVTLLRNAIARIERGGSPAITRPAPGAGGPCTAPVHPAAPASPAIALGAARLDRLLGGGLARGGLHEVVPDSARDEGAASRFALGVAVCGLLTHGAVVWIVESGAAGESGAPYRPGLLHHGLDPDRLIVVRTRSAAETLWAAEEALRDGGVLVMAELWGGRHYGLAPSRRLVLAARARGATAVLVHAGVGESTRALSTGCDTRLVVAARPSRRGTVAIGTLPVPGPPAFALRLAKARAARGAIDPDATFTLHWNAAQRCFHDTDHPVALAAAPAHGPARGPDRHSGWRPGA